MKNPEFSVWMAWLGATLVAAVTMSAFAFSTFETKGEAMEKKHDIVKSLDEIKTELHELNRKVDNL